jgi:hypothetical protein
MKEIDRKIFGIVKNPDSLNNSSVSNNITFIYDQDKDILYAEPYPAFHKDIRNKTPALQHIRNNQETVSNGLLLGRTGVLPNKTKVISFWNAYFKSLHLLANCLNNIIKKYPIFNDPNTIVMADQLNRFDPHKNTFNAVPLSEFSGVHVTNNPQQASDEEQKPWCNVNLDILGVSTSLSDILGNFHMVKDNRLPAMKTAVCSQGPQQECLYAVNSMVESASDAFRSATNKIGEITITASVHVDKQSSCNRITFKMAEQQYRKFLLKFAVKGV